jgi:hypothetical protein
MTGLMIWAGLIGFIVGGFAGAGAILGFRRLSARPKTPPEGEDTGQVVLAPPTDAQDAATKACVDSQLSGPEFLVRGMEAASVDPDPYRMEQLDFERKIIGLMQPPIPAFGKPKTIIYWSRDATEPYVCNGDGCGGRAIYEGEVIWVIPFADGELPYCGECVASEEEAFSAAQILAGREAADA